MSERPGKPLPDGEAFLIAAALIEAHGEEAEIIAVMKADELLDAGELDALAHWMPVLYAIDEMRRTAPRSGEAAH